jgi:hypothetical protein
MADRLLDQRVSVALAWPRIGRRVRVVAVGMPCATVKLVAPSSGERCDDLMIVDRNVSS